MISVLPNWHPVFVHFTVALLIVAAAIHLLSHFMSNRELANQLTIVARWNLWIGVGFTLLTVAAGWYAYNTVNHDAPAHIAMTEHRNWAMATLVLFLGVAGWEYYLHRHGKNKGWLFTGLLAIAAALLLSTAWHGGELVYRYGLGVMSMPKPEGQGHTHEHGDESLQGENADGLAQSHDDASGEHAHDAEPDHKIPAADGAGTAPKAGHTHAPGTPPHKD
ncbi:MAG: DUF2231 domain-containing protein [Gallionella sp.]